MDGDWLSTCQSPAKQFVHGGVRRNSTPTQKTEPGGHVSTFKNNTKTVSYQLWKAAHNSTNPSAVVYQSTKALANTNSFHQCFYNKFLQRDNVTTTKEILTKHSSNSRWPFIPVSSIQLASSSMKKESRSEAAAKRKHVLSTRGDFQAHTFHVASYLSAISKTQLEESK